MSLCCTVGYKWVTLMDGIEFEFNDIISLYKKNEHFYGPKRWWQTQKKNKKKTHIIIKSIQSSLRSESKIVLKFKTIDYLYNSRYIII